MKHLFRECCEVVCRVEWKQKGEMIVIKLSSNALILMVILFGGEEIYNVGTTCKCVS